MINYALNEKIAIIHSWIDKKDIVEVSEYFTERKPAGGKVH